MAEGIEVECCWLKVEGVKAEGWMLFVEDGGCWGGEVRLEADG